MNLNEHSIPGCESLHRMRRRDWMLKTASTSTLAGLGLTQIAESLARASESPRDDVSGKQSTKARSLIVLWMQGGPSQLETFDPRPNTKIGGEVEAISTSIAGIEIANTLPQTAEQMHLATLIRSMVSKEGDHERASYHLKTGWRPDPTLVHPSIGAVLCHQTNDNLEIPRHISIASGQWPARGGYLGGEFDAFITGDPRDGLGNLHSPNENSTIREKLGSMSNIVEAEFARNRFAHINRQKTQHQTMTQRAESMMSSDQIKAFDVMQESESMRTRFGDTAFGRGCLAAIRLIEQGVRCVEVELNGWDSHANNHGFQSARCNDLDPALSSLLKELEARDLLDSTIVLCGGEFGRTPQINVAGGRDHWPTGFSTLLAGGPFRRGYVHGATAENPSEESNKRLSEIHQSVTVQQLHATILDALGIEFTKELQTPIGRPLVLSEGSVVKELVT